LARAGGETMPKLWRRLPLLLGLLTDGADLAPSWPRQLGYGLRPRPVVPPAAVPMRAAPRRHPVRLAAEEGDATAEAAREKSSALAETVASDNAPAEKAVAENTPAETAAAAAMAKWTNLHTVDNDSVHLHAARQLRDRGFVVLPSVGISPERVEQVRQEVEKRFSGLLDDVDKLGIDPVQQQYRFSEIATRQKNRWDLRIKQSNDDAPLLTSLCQDAAALATPVIEKLHTLLPRRTDDAGWRGLQGLGAAQPKLDSLGAIVSLQGAKPQRFHSDASKRHFALASALPRHRLFNVFVPLVDIAEDSYGPQFWPGSHLERTRMTRYRQVLSRSTHVEDDPRTMLAMEAPACQAGGLIIFDYRILHRGLANSAIFVRPVAYAVLSTGGARDTVKFPSNSLRSAAATLPTNASALSSLRAAIRSQYSFWDDLPDRETDIVQPS